MHNPIAVLHSRLKYRPDIDGLRAVAVLLVVADHLDTRIRGGFIGVDVFFVISGYLISAMILADFQKGQFSLADFYERRVRRIAPALIILLLVVSAMAYLRFTPQEAQSYGSTLLGCVLSLANFIFWHQSGYFDAASSSKPLLHTWSLAVEEQFYVVFPLFVMLVWKFLRDKIKPAILIVALLSFAASIAMVKNNPSSAFYLLPFRGWELLLGTIVSQNYLPRPHTVVTRNACSLAGLALILVPAFQYTGSTPFPGLAAVPPCLGAALIILAGEEGGSSVGALLSTRPATFIGRISYSLYLWHWPLIVFQTTNRLFFRPSHATHALIKPGIFLLSLVAATLSWAFVEEPFRKGRLRPARGPLFAVTGIGAATAVAIALAIHATNGFSSRFPTAAKEVASFATRDFGPDMGAGHCFFTSHQENVAANLANCVAEHPGRPSILLIGDSHAADLWPGLTATYRESDIRELAVSGCRPLLDAQTSSLDRCGQVYRFLFRDFLPHHPVDTVLISGRWDSSELPALARTITWIQNHGMKAVVVGPSPEFEGALPNLLAVAMRRNPNVTLLDLDAFEDPKRKTLDDTMSQLAATQWHVHYISIFRSVCEGGCPLWTKPGVPLLFDREHFTPDASRSLVRLWRRDGLL